MGAAPLNVSLIVLMKNDRGPEVQPQTPEEEKPSQGEDLLQRMLAFKESEEQSRRLEQDMTNQLVLDIAELVAGREDLQKLLAENPDILVPKEKGAEIAKFKEEYTKKTQQSEKAIQKDEEFLPSLEQTLNDMGEPVSPERRKAKEKLQEEFKEFRLGIEERRKEAEVQKRELESRIQEVRDRMKIKADEVRESEPDPLTHAIDNVILEYQKDWERAEKFATAPQFPVLRALWEEAQQKAGASGENPFGKIDKAALREKIIPALITQARDKRSAGAREHEARALETERGKLEKSLSDLADQIREWFDKRKIVADKQRTLEDKLKKIESTINGWVGATMLTDSMRAQLKYNSDKESFSAYVERIKKIKMPSVWEDRKYDLRGESRHERQLIKRISHSKEFHEADRLTAELSKYKADEEEFAKQESGFLLQYETLIRQGYEKFGHPLKSDLSDAFYNNVPYSDNSQYKFGSDLKERLVSVADKVFSENREK